MTIMTTLHIITITDAHLSARMRCYKDGYNPFIKVYAGEIVLRPYLLLECEYERNMSGPGKWRIADYQHGRQTTVGRINAAVRNGYHCTRDADDRRQAWWEEIQAIIDNRWPGCDLRSKLFVEPLAPAHRPTEESKAWMACWHALAS